MQIDEAEQLFNTFRWPFVLLEPTYRRVMNSPVKMASNPRTWFAPTGSSIHRAAIAVANTGVTLLHAAVRVVPARCTLVYQMRYPKARANTADVSVSAQV